MRRIVSSASVIPVGAPANRRPHGSGSWRRRAGRQDI